MLWNELWIVALALFASSLGQSIFGFGYGLFAVILLLQAGLALPEALVVLAVTGVGQPLTGIYKLRSDLDWRALRLVLVMTLLGLPLGIGILQIIQSWDHSRIKQFVGIIVALAVLMQWLWKIKPRPQLHWGWAVLAGLVAGILCGTVGMAGPVIVLWVMAHDWSTRQIRVSIWTIFLAICPIYLILLYQHFGNPVIQIALQSLLLFPAVILGTLIGVPLGNRLKQKQLRLLAFGLLLILSVAAILGPYL